MLRFLLLYRIASYCRQPGGGPASAQRRSQERAEAATQEKGQKGMLFGKGMNFLLLSVKGPWASSSGSIQVSFPKSPSSFFFPMFFGFLIYVFFVLSCSHPFVGQFCTLFVIPFLPCILAPLHHISFQSQMLTSFSGPVYLLFISTIWCVGFPQVWMHPFGKIEDVAWTSSMYGAVWSASKTLLAAGCDTMFGGCDGLPLLFRNAITGKFWNSAAWFGR